MLHGGRGLREGQKMNHDKQLLAYRQLVNKILKYHHYDIEAGLRRADEQEEFVYAVWRQLLKLGWSIHITMDYKFNAVFNVECATLAINDQKTHIYAVLSELAEVAPEGARLYVSSRKQDYLSCSIKFGARG